MDFDKKPLILVGIAIFALLVMGVGLAFKKEFKTAGTSDISSGQVSRFSSDGNLTP